MIVSKPTEDLSFLTLKTIEKVYKTSLFFQNFHQSIVTHHLLIMLQIFETALKAADCNRTPFELRGAPEDSPRQHPNPWPSTLNLKQVVKNLGLVDPVVCLSEKMDGENFSISTDGCLFSRNLILSGKVVQTYTKVFTPTIRQNLEVLKECLGASEVVVFGEMFHKARNLDNFGYRKRQIMGAEEDLAFYAFGALLKFDNDDDKAIKLEKLKSLNFWRFTNENGFEVLVYNETLKSLFDAVGFKTPDIYGKALKFNQIFTNLEDSCFKVLEAEKIEGFVLSFDQIPLEVVSAKPTITETMSLVKLKCPMARANMHVPHVEKFDNVAHKLLHRLQVSKQQYLQDMLDFLEKHRDDAIEHAMMVHPPKYTQDYLAKPDRTNTAKENALAKYLKLVAGEMLRFYFGLEQFEFREFHEVFKNLPRQAMFDKLGDDVKAFVFSNAQIPTDVVKALNNEIASEFHKDDLIAQ